MRLKWTRRALQQLADAQEFIAHENPVAAHEVATRIVAATQLLLSQPRIGRPGRVSGTREWVIDRTQYLLVYAVAGDELRVLRLLHSKQHWVPPLPQS